MKPPRQSQEGFTLVETVIAMMIMAIAVVTIVSALSVMLTFAAEHRGHAVVEVDSRSFGQAVQAQAQFTTQLSSDLPDSDGAATLIVADASLVPPSGDSAETFALVGREVMRIDSVQHDDDTVSVTRAQGGDQSAHVAGASVSTFLRCPLPEHLTPVRSPHHLGSGSDADVTSVEYWRSAGGGNGQFVDWTACDSDFKAKCPTDVRPECTSGFFRVGLKLSIPDDSRLNTHDMQTTTTILVRRGSA